MRRSIRWSLLLGHAALLAVVIGGFGALLYLKVRESTLGAVDAELLLQARSLAASMTPVSEDRFELVLSESQTRYFNSAGSFVIWNRRGVADFSDPRFVEPEFRRDLRAVALVGPAGSKILVGRPFRQEREQLAGLLELILGIGILVFAVGFVGGWLLIGRILDPIRRITQTAGTISASNLSSRIDVAATENELGDLARTLNSAFDRIEGALERQTRFTADASHELRTPLSVLMTQMESALRRPRESPEYREVLETCLKAVRRMTSLVESLLQLSHLGAPEGGRPRERLDLKEVVEESARQVRPLAEERGISLSVRAASHSMNGDTLQLGRAVTNLLVNAIQYNRPQGSVEVSVSRGQIEVSDTGPGIPDADRDHVFERFYRADKARSREVGGAGLGLAITKAIVESHGGTISFESRNGSGTTFRIKFP